MIRIRNDAPSRTALERTAFAILGATSRDSRRRIVELGEEKALVADNEVCAQARADLTNPRKRVAEEAAWLAGLSPARARNYCDLLGRDLEGLLTSAQSESPLVQANLIAAALEQFDSETEAVQWETWLLALADAVERIDPESVRRLLNEDRVVAGFPEIPTLEPIEAELAERRRAYRNVMKEALIDFQLPSCWLSLIGLWTLRRHPGVDQDRCSLTNSSMHSS